METPLPDIVEEARRILAAAKEQRVTVRLVGGVAIRLTSPSAAIAPLQRSYKDVDLVGRGSDTRALKEFFRSLGYVPRETFNAMQSGRRMVFNDMANQRRVDVFQDYFEMCHKFDLRKRLDIREDTLPLADLLETKLQVIQANDKDYRDMIALLADHPLAEREGNDLIDSSHLTGLCADDWGIFKTFNTGLGRVLGALDSYRLESELRQKVDGRARELLRSIEGAPKTLRWKLRARVGEKVPWYETPEADAQVIDSRF